MVLLYMVTWIPSIYPQMLAYIPAPWILWVWIILGPLRLPYLFGFTLRRRLKGRCLFLGRSLAICLRRVASRISPSVWTTTWNGMGHPKSPIYHINSYYISLYIYIYCYCYVYYMYIYILYYIHIYIYIYIFIYICIYIYM